MFRFVTIIPLEFWAIVLLLLFMWVAFGLNGLVITVVGLAPTLRYLAWIAGAITHRAHERDDGGLTFCE